MRSWFLKRYPGEIVDEEILVVKFHFSRKIKPKGKEEKKCSFDILIVTYHARLNCLSKIISEDLSLIYMNEENKRGFSPKPIISFRTTRKLSNYLVGAKICPIERSVGSFKCDKKRCEVCEIVNKTENFNYFFSYA